MADITTLSCEDPQPAPVEGYTNQITNYDAERLMLVLASFIGELQEFEGSRELSFAITKLQEGEMWLGEVDKK